MTMQHHAKQRSLEQRGRFLAEIQFYNVQQFVWLDETGSDRRDHMRKFGYSLVGEPPIYHHLLHQGKRISAIAAMSTAGLVTYELVDGSVDGHKFLEFVQRKLIP